MKTTLSADETLEKMKAVQAQLKALAQSSQSSARIETGTSFVQSLVEANSRGTGALIEADMEEESTRLETQQQLALQSQHFDRVRDFSILTHFEG